MMMATVRLIGLSMLVEQFSLWRRPWSPHDAPRHGDDAWADGRRLPLTTLGDRVGPDCGQAVGPVPTLAPVRAVSG